MSAFKIVARFSGIIKKVQTVSGGDGAYRVTIDIPLTCKEEVKRLMDLQDKVCGVAVGELTDEEPQDERKL